MGRKTSSSKWHEEAEKLKAQAERLPYAVSAKRLRGRCASWKSHHRSMNGSPLRAYSHQSSGRQGRSSSRALERSAR
jgi:hypothetical protein